MADGEPSLITRTRAFRAARVCEVSFGGRSVSNGSGERVRVGPVGPRRWKFNSSVLLSKIFSPPRPRHASLPGYSRHCRTTTAVHVPRTYTYSREEQTAKIASPFPRPAPRSQHPFTKFVLLLFSFRGRRSGRPRSTIGEDGLPTFCPRHAAIRESTYGILFIYPHVTLAAFSPT